MLPHDSCGISLTGFSRSHSFWTHIFSAIYTSYIATYRTSVIQTQNFNYIVFVIDEMLDFLDKVAAILCCILATAETLNKVINVSTKVPVWLVCFIMFSSNWAVFCIQMLFQMSCRRGLDNWGYTVTETSLRSCVFDNKINGTSFMPIVCR